MEARMKTRQRECLFIKLPPPRCVPNVHSAQSFPPFFSPASSLMLLEGDQGITDVETEPERERDITEWLSNSIAMKFSAIFLTLI